MDFYKKLFLGTLTIVVAIILIIKFSLSSIENRIIEITKSEKFYNFISQRFKYEMNTHSSKELTQEDVENFTTSNFKNLFKINI